MFGKRPNELTREDIQRIVSEEVPEGGDVEYKETLPAKKGKTNPWLEGKGEVGDKARDEILEEVIAFANAHGGTLVVGIRETDGRPKRAAGILPIPACTDLSDRLRLQCRDCIDPQIPLLEVAGVPTNKDGSGVVVFRVPQSRMAPHRHTQTLHCYVRRADRSEKMTMREIQELTLQVERGLSAIEAKFETQRKRLKVFDNGFGMRATLIPLSPLYIERVHENEAVKPHLHGFTGTLGKSGPYTLHVPVHVYYWRPILRGTLGTNDNERFLVLLKVHCDGVVDYSLSVQPEEEPRVLSPEWVIALVCNALCTAERFRRTAGAPEAEYGLKLEVQVRGAPLPVSPYGRNLFRDTLGPLPGEQMLFPRYSIGRPEEFQKVTALIDRDFWHVVGIDPKPEEELTVAYAAAFEALGLPPAE